ncbi:MAG: SIR2 family protein [Planctomycetota bacterium]
MRFFPSATDIPDDLIRAVLSGEVVFLCGAGVSKRAGLPLFDELTEMVYTRMGESPRNDPAEATAFDRREYDRVLRSLEKRTHVPRAVSRVREAVAALLAADGGASLPDHVTLLRLSRNLEGQPRLLTTNFDTLFERAAINAGLALVPSHATKALPKPGSDRDHGVLHLHGRLGYPALHLELTDLVLTSADFGDAYLRDGWASRYVEDRMRLDTLVLVGYGAEDAALRLLLETLDADRNRFRDLKRIFAIDAARGNSSAIWRAKGIQPIEFASHDELYASLAEWANLSERPVAYGRERLRAVLGKPPDHTDDFEREQAKFFLGAPECADSLADMNPSLAWLPLLAKWQAIGLDDPRLASWIERRFVDVDAVSDVVAGIGMLRQETARLLGNALQRRERDLPAVLAKSWRLIIRHCETTPIGLAHYAWFEIKPRVSSGDHCPEIMEKLVDALRPKLRVSKRIVLHESEPRDLRHPRDLMSIEYEAADGVTPEEVLEAWPADATSVVDADLIDRLGAALDAALADATDVGVEGGSQWSMSDMQVPSVANHAQNSHQSGFLSITRVMADLWLRLSAKDPAAAIQRIGNWSRSNYRLVRRLALFACSSSATPGVTAAATLLEMPQAELFLTSSTVEVARLLHTRWSEFPAATREQLEARLRDGPPTSIRMVDSEMIDRCRYDALGQLILHGCELTEESRRLLGEIQERYPNWGQRSPERAGFHVWHEVMRSSEVSEAWFKDVQDEALVETAERRDSGDRFGDQPSWAALCRADPDKALRGLEALGIQREVPSKHWKEFLWSDGSHGESDRVQRVARCVLAWPDNKLRDLAGDLAFWHDRGGNILPEDDFFAVWDRIYACRGEDVPVVGSRDVFTATLNSVPGRLAQALLSRIRKAHAGTELPQPVQARFERLLATPGATGELAVARVAAEVGWLYDLAPEWTGEVLLPVFEWSSARALVAWSARTYATYLGSPACFSRTKRAFLELFGRPDVPASDKETYAGWLPTILIARQCGRPYTLDYPEARQALRLAGAGVLPSVGHVLAQEMEGTQPAEKKDRWRQVVGPAFAGLWPLDVELQTSATAFKLVQLLRATGDAFPEAADAIIPFVRSEGDKYRATVFSVAHADEAIYQSAPDRVLDLLVALVGDNPGQQVFALRTALDRIRDGAPRLAETVKFQRLLAIAGPS